MSIRALVVDDAAVFRKAVSTALAGLPGVEVVGTAANGRLALSRIEALRPDLVTLDIEMSEMNGIEVLDSLRSAGTKTAAVVLSAHTLRGGEMTVRALERGAFDFLTKPDGGTSEQNLERLRAGLTPIVRALERHLEIRSILRRDSQATERPETPVASVPQRSPRPTRSAGKPFIVVGVSTGGPAALARLLPALPGGLGVPVFVVQHMPAFFTGPLAASLALKCALRVKEAGHGESAAPDCVYVAPGGRQMKLVPGAQDAVVINITDDPPENNYRPAVDYLFRSAALSFPGRAMAVILTGMGNDGTAGMKMLKRGGSFTVAQDQTSSVVFGMPKEAIRAGVVDKVLPLDGIAPAIFRWAAEALA